jgi:hypothetical protein
MKKIIIITFLSFFISSVSYSNSKDFVTRKEDIINIFNCKIAGETILFSTVYKNINPGVVFMVPKKNNYETSMLMSNIYLKNFDNTKFYSFFGNFEGKRISRFIFLQDHFIKSIENKTPFDMNIETIVYVDQKEFLKLYKDWENIVFNKDKNYIYDLNYLLEKNFTNKEELKKIENFSNSLNNLFISEYNKLENLKRIKKPFIENIIITCDSPKTTNLKN